MSAEVTRKGHFWDSTTPAETDKRNIIDKKVKK